VRKAGVINEMKAVLNTAEIWRRKLAESVIYQCIEAKRNHHQCENHENKYHRERAVANDINLKTISVNVKMTEIKYISYKLINTI
jgi:hypothetical protein